MNLNIHLTLLVTLVLLFAGCLAEHSDKPAEPAAIESAVPLGNRLFTLSITEAGNEGFDEAFTLARELGMQGTELAVFWDEIETEPGIFAPEMNWLEIANIFYPSVDTSVALTISIIDTTNTRLPADLAALPFDDPQTMERFKKLLDYVKAQVPDLSLISLTIGNEVDIHLGEDMKRWAEYERFFCEAATYAHTLWPGLPVGSKVTFGGLDSPSQLAAIQSLTGYADVAMITYYPLDGQFQVRNPKTVHEDLNAIATAFGDRPVHLMEAGYPSGDLNGSSEETQAAFIHELFLAWDAHADRFPLLNITWLTDMPTAAVREMEDYYGLTDAAFGSYLETLGLRRHDGSPKAALAQLEAELKTR